MPVQVARSAALCESTPSEVGLADCLRRHHRFQGVRPFRDLAPGLRRYLELLCVTVRSYRSLA